MCFPQQAISAQPCWESLYGSLGPFKQCLITDQFKSRQPSTMNRYLLECRKLISWCNDVKIQFVLPTFARCFSGLLVPTVQEERVSQHF